MSTVRDNPAQHRYEIYDGDRLAGFSDYKLTKTKVAFTHTEVDPAFGGRGLARELPGYVGVDDPDVRHLGDTGAGQ